MQKNILDFSEKYAIFVGYYILAATALFQQTFRQII